MLMFAATYNALQLATRIHAHTSEFAKRSQHFESSVGFVRETPADSKNLSTISKWSQCSVIIDIL